jgi:hypothetical chaperone protein
VHDCIAAGGSAARKFRRLNELIQRNLSYSVFQSIKDLKARLSSEETARLDIPELDLDLTVTRAQFEGIIAAQLAEVEVALDRTLTLSGLRADAIDIVIGTGGSSLIPAVRRLLVDRFPRQVVEHDPFTSVAAGLAIADYRHRLRAG